MHCIFIHGLFHQPWVLKLLAQRCETLLQPKTSQLFGYDTRHYSADVLEDLHKCVISVPENDEIIFIAHSMGGLVVRHYLALFPRLHVKVITLGTPHTGSFVARFLEQYRVSRWLLKDALVSGLASGDIPEYQKQYPLLSISGIQCYGWASFLGKKIHDGTVLEEETLLPHAEHVSLRRLSHNAMLYDKRVVRAIQDWLTR